MRYYCCKPVFYIVINTALYMKEDIPSKEELQEIDPAAIGCCLLVAAIGLFLGVGCGWVAIQLIF